MARTGSIVASSLALLALSAAAGGHPVPGAHDGHAGHGGHVVRSAPTVDRALVLGADDHVYRSMPGWCQLPDGAPLGNTHGAIVIDRRGLVYFNTDTARSILVYSPQGRFLRSFAEAYPGFHGMVLRVEDGVEHIYAAHLQGAQVVKLRLDGTVVWTLGVPVESGKYDDDPGAYRPTAVAVAPNGDLFVADGYGRHWVHQFTAEREYVRSFGGPGEGPGQFRTPHGLAIDARGKEPCLLVCDRENRRLQRFDLQGRHLDVPVTGLRRPCSVSIRGEELAVAELEGRVTILDGRFAIKAHLGDNPQRAQWARNDVPTAAWVDGVFTAPHACCFDEAGNLYVMDWNAAGRISKLMREKKADS